MSNVTALRTTSVTTWDQAVERFLATRDLAPGTQRVYRLTLERIAQHLPTQKLREVPPESLSRALDAAYPHASPNSWNRHVATLRSFCGFCARHGWLPDDITNTLERRRPPADHTRALSAADLDRLWARKGVPVRDRCLWRMLFETAARAQEVLRLNIEDLDLAQRRAATVRKGGAVDFLHWASGTARLLPYVIDGRTQGPLFTSSRPIQARRAPAAADIDPTTGHARLSYARAAQAFTQTTGGWTLHQLRHTALTRLAEAGVPLPLLMAKSRHESLRTLQRYARPGPDAVAALTAQHDPARRR